MITGDMITPHYYGLSPIYSTSGTAYNTSATSEPRLWLNDLHAGDLVNEQARAYLVALKQHWATTSAANASDVGMVPREWWSGSSGTGCGGTLTITYPRPNVANPDYPAYPISYDPHDCLLTSKEVQPVKHLFAIYVVSMWGVILLDKKVVASDPDEAKFIAEVDGCIRAAKLAPKDVTVLCHGLGQVKTEAEPQKVKLVTEA